ncbi:MAG: hypothetical protein ACRDVL_02250 [Acidimicrobiia bacterium]
MLDRSLFDRLAEMSGETLISVYLPTHVKGAETKQDRIRLKNGLAEVDAELESAGWTPKDRAARLDPARLLLEDEEFWQHQGPGLGVLVDDEARMTTVALRTGVMERTVISPVFHLRPAIPSLRTVELPVLLLTKGAVRLYRASRHEISQLDADLPESFEDVNWFVDREPQRQRHPDATGTKRGRHGHEGGYREEDLERFLRAVADALPDPGGPTPLVVLGDDNLAARFAKVYEQETVSPPHGGIDDIDDIVELRGKATEVVESHEKSLLLETLDEAKEHLATGAAITDIDQGLTAAVSGRIGTLLLDADAPPRWGEFDPDTLQTVHYQDRKIHAVDLLDRLAIHAIGTGAEVVTTDGPIEGQPLLAVTRF